MDKVLVHNALSTLDVLVVALLVVGLFEVILKGLREYLLAHTTTRIDIRLGVKLFKHLLGLPLLYFKTACGSRRHSGKRTRQYSQSSYWRCADVISGCQLYLCIYRCDVLSLRAVNLVSYRNTASICVYRMGKLWVSKTAYRTPVQLRRQKYGFLTESLNGVETVKSLAIEPRFERKWEGQTQELVEANFSRQSYQAQISQWVTLVQKLTTVGVLWIGAQMVMSLELTIGQLIAFNMMVNHVSQPLAKLVELWQQFIQTRVAVDNLGEMLNLPAEQEMGRHASNQPFQGHIQFRHVWFRYQPQLAPVLKGLSLDIRPGESIGLVGPSGSGKSTITRVIQKLYLAEKGHVLIDGVPINQWSSSALRKNIGVVLQENYLFHRSVRENIAIRRPTASFEQVVEAAKLAGAHEFIIKMPKGYDTMLAEGGSSLSGGQKQRIAIARALMTKPRILILDEATSALDEESQQVVNQNMVAISACRTGHNGRAPFICGSRLRPYCGD